MPISCTPSDANLLKITFKRQQQQHQQHRQENVVLLFARRASDPAWFRELVPYWDSLPASVFTKEMYEPEHMELLQDEELVSGKNERKRQEKEPFFLFFARRRC